MAAGTAPMVLCLLFWFFMHYPVSAWYVLALDVAVLVPTFLVLVHLRKELARLARMRK